MPLLTVTLRTSDLGGLMQADPTIPLAEYGELSELFRFYLGLVLETVTFTLGVAGGIVTYVLKERKSKEEVFGLVIPAILCLGMGIGFLRALGYISELRNRLGVVATALGIGLAPHVSTLSGSVWFFGLVLTSVGIGLLILIIPLYRRPLKTA
jgi:hypothetical protein